MEKEHHKHLSSEEPESSEDSQLFRVCAYIGDSEGFAVAHPRRQTAVPPEHLQEWMDMLVENSKLAMRKVELQLDWWKSFNDPFVVFDSEGGKPLAAMPARGKAAPHLVDMNTGNKTLLDTATAKNLQPHAYVFYEILPEAVTTIRGLFAFGCGAIKQRVWPLIVVLGILGSVRLILPIANQQMFDRVIPSANATVFWQLSSALVIMWCAEFALSIIRGFSILRLQVHLESKLQTALWERMINLSLSAFRQFTAADISDRLTLVEKIRSHVEGKNLYALCDAPFSLFFAFLMLYYSVELGLVALTTLAVVALVALMLRKHVQPLISEAGEQRIEQHGFMSQVARGITTVRLAAAEERVYEQWVGRFAVIEKLKNAISSKEKYFVMIRESYVILSLVIIYGVVAYHFKINGTLPFSLTIGTFVGFQTAFFLLSSTISDLLEFMPAYMEIERACSRTEALLAHPLEQTGPKHNVEKIAGAIRVDNLTFQYPGTTSLTLSDVSFACEPGEFVGIIGRSGSGKSTILRCLIGLEAPKGGNIYYDGNNILDLNIDALRRRIGAVLQGSHIFMGSVKANLLMGRHASRQAIDRALELSCFDEVLKKLPMGLKTFIAGGDNPLFSGGELQRLLIARALICDIDILLLDEATSALDGMTQSKVMENLASLKITRLIVAHRLETIRHADQILVVKDGKIAAQGTFDALGLHNA